jgi:hypothetical protein
MGLGKNMLKFTHPFFYNIEGAAMYVQRKIFGKYATSSWGLRIIRVTFVIATLSLTYLTYILTGWHPYYVGSGFLVFGLLCLLSYYQDEQYDKIDDYEILSDFNKLSNRTRFFYLLYVFGFCFLLPLTLIIVLVLYKIIQ